MSPVINIREKIKDITVDNAVIYYHNKVKEAHLIYGSLIALGLGLAGLLCITVSSFSAGTTVLAISILSYYRFSKCKNRLYLDIINNLRGSDVEHFFRFIDEDPNDFLEEMR